MHTKQTVLRIMQVNRLAKLEQCGLEANREQRLINRVPYKEVSHADCDLSTTNPGEVIHPELLTHCATKSLDPEGMKLKSRDANSEFTSRFLVRIKSSEQEGDRIRLGSRNDGRNRVSLGTGETETSPKLCEDKSPISKVTKVSRGPRGGKASACHRKKGMFSNRENNKNDPSKGKARNDCRQGHSRASCLDPGRVAAADVLHSHCTTDKIPDSFLNEDEQQRNGRTAASSCDKDGSDARPAVKVPSPTGRAWMQDDALRPTCLPSLRKQQGLLQTPKYSSIPWSVPANPPADVASTYQCPICTEDLDSTDSSFDPCPCGFRLCLFCYHKIASDDGRCPGCRKTYEQRTLY